MTTQHGDTDDKLEELLDRIIDYAGALGEDRVPHKEMAPLVMVTTAALKVIDDHMETHREFATQAGLNMMAVLKEIMLHAYSEEPDQRPN